VSSQEAKSGAVVLRKELGYTHPVFTEAV